MYENQKLAAFCKFFIFVDIVFYLFVFSREILELQTYPSAISILTSREVLEEATGFDWYFLDHLDWALLIAALFGLVVRLVWVYRAMRNAQNIYSARGWITPKWSVIWQLVPVLNWIFGYRALVQIWNGTFQNDLKSHPRTYFSTWWTCWIAGDILSFASIALFVTALIIDAPGHYEYRLANTLSILSAPPILVYCWCFYRFLSEVTDRQSNHLQT